ncbi:hypothetical protein [Pseudobacteriovorax antillogorgiicola]|uniref:Lipoprotein n=1 Tax=Pseudobacteriovorax antillogorgiicola TaxID=1513793 RepID=A0A1Y6CJT0_9BACT|nr:hypothetical protein [Pseudobacteriovorax antillogorgiicola]TCS45925.1 hypothetical protein EDD56_12688 [Pseudobacteriovorax antillogorgiicola]SMF71028.1 hypothetical protein SAMN06296036_12610 [Pseudobacteriovorax antillogorgiicola]
MNRVIIPLLSIVIMTSCSSSDESESPNPVGTQNRLKKDNDSSADSFESKSESPTDVKIQPMPVSGFSDKNWLDVSYEKRCLNLVAFVETYKQQYLQDEGFSLSILCDEPFPRSNYTTSYVMTTQVFEEPDITALELESEIILKLNQNSEDTAMVQHCIKKGPCASSLESVLKNFQVQGLMPFAITFDNYIQNPKQNEKLVIGQPQNEFIAEIQSTVLNEGFEVERCDGRKIKAELIEDSEENVVSGSVRFLDADPSTFHPIDGIITGPGKTKFFFLRFTSVNELLASSDVTYEFIGSNLIFRRLIQNTSPEAEVMAILQHYKEGTLPDCV